MSSDLLIAACRQAGEVDESAIQTLLDSNADPNYVTSEGITPLNMAAATDNIKLVSKLLQSGALIETPHNIAKFIKVVRDLFANPSNPNDPNIIYIYI